jgi:hypothetical protein
MSRPRSERLDSWKEIADYLRRDLRTVRRWERTRSLPIRRVPGVGRRAVYAFRHEIDAWLSATSLPLDPTSGENTSDTVIGREASVATDTTITRLELRRFLNLKRIVIVGAILVVGAVSLASLRRRSLPSPTTSNETPPRIVAVSQILPKRDQLITIKGSGFGLHMPYKDADTPFIAIRDKTAGWAAGRIIPQNWDEITLSLDSWQDNQIVISGFSGAYGTGQWMLAPGDEVEIAIWNPQSGIGPAVYRQIVSASAAEK